MNELSPSGSHDAVYGHLERIDHWILGCRLGPDGENVCHGY